MVSVVAYAGCVALVACERMLELRLSARNAAWSFERGGIEVGQGHFPWMRLLHIAFLLACVGEVVGLHRAYDARLAGAMLTLVLMAQGLRYWAIGTLGPRWNVRVIVVPGLAAVNRGPYRYLRHPNYVAVMVEGFALPLMHGAWITALVFSALNLLLLRTRVRYEEQALRTHCAYDVALESAG